MSSGGLNAHRSVRHDIILQSASASVLYHFRCALSRSRHDLPSERLDEASFQCVLMGVRWHEGRKKILKCHFPQDVGRVIKKSIVLANICSVSIWLMMMSSSAHLAQVHPGGELLSHYQASQNWAVKTQSSLILPSSGPSPSNRSQKSFHLCKVQGGGRPPL